MVILYYYFELSEKFNLFWKFSLKMWPVIIHEAPEAAHPGSVFACGTCSFRRAWQYLP